MKKLLGVAALLVIESMHALAQTGNPACPFFLPTPVSTTSSGSTTLGITLPAGKSGVRICGYTINVVQGATPVNFSLVYGTGASCTSASQITLVYTGVANSTQVYSQFFGDSIAVSVASTYNTCINLSGSTATSLSVQVQYGFF